MRAAAFLFGVAFGLLGYAWIAAPEHRRALQQRDHYRDLYAASVFGPVAKWGPVDTSNESTPIADAIDFELWGSELTTGDEQ